MHTKNSCFMSVIHSFIPSLCLKVPESPSIYQPAASSQAGPYALLNNVTDRQTNKQTDRQTDANTYAVMARTKQATPLRREPSSQYSLRSRDAAGATNEKPNGHSVANGNANDLGRGQKPHAPASAAAKKNAGILTLVIDVAGIYASLFVSPYPTLFISSWAKPCQRQQTDG